MLEAILSIFKIIPSAVVAGLGVAWIMTVLQFMREKKWRDSATYIELTKRYPIATSIMLEIFCIIMMVIGFGLLKLALWIILYL